MLNSKHSSKDSNLEKDNVAFLPLPLYVMGNNIKMKYFELFLSLALL